jgi:hypothetical protein
MVQHQKLFQDNNIPKSYLTQIRGFSWHKNEIKMMRGHYSSNNFHDSNKGKRTESKKHWVISQECFSLTLLS